MKKISLNIILTIKSTLISFLSREGSSVLLGCVLFGLITSCWASMDEDKKFQLDRVGILRATDNVDGLFADYVTKAYNAFFSTQSRFMLSDMSEAYHVINHSKLSDQKVANDPEILHEIARRTRSDTILRTKIVKEGHRYFFDIDWFHYPQMELIANLKFFLEEPSPGASLGLDAITRGFKEHLPELFSQIPFFGNVTGRDSGEVTLNIGTQAGITPGTRLSIGTLDGVKRHPILNSIEDWQLTSVGEVEVESSEDSVAFAKILMEQPGKQISRYQKVTHIQLPASSPHQKTTETSDVEQTERQTSLEPVNENQTYIPKLGWIAGGLFLGSTNWQFDSQKSSIVNTGGGMPLGGKLQSEIWLTRSWFANFDLGYSFWNFTQQNANTGVQTPVSKNGGVSATSTSMTADVGYSYLMSDDMTGSRIFAKAGYKKISNRLPQQGSPEYTGETSLGSFFFGIGSDVTFLDSWGALLSFNFGLINSGSQTGWSGSVTDASYFGLNLGGYYKLNSRTRVRFGMDLESMGLKWGTDSNLSQKTVTFGPSILYYF